MLFGQEFRATLTGRVLDAGGVPIPKAKVLITHTATGEARDLTTDMQGNYLAPLLNPGIYTVRAEAQGFKVFIQSGLQLTVNQTATLDLKLELGSMETKITVTAEAALLDDANGDRGGLIDEQAVKEYPLNSRNPFMLAMLTGKERTRREFEELLEASGFRLDRVLDIGLATSMLEASVV